MSIKPKMSYARRMEAPDELWVIWSNKWGCWYRAKSNGYTNDMLQAGLFTRAEALTHYNPNEPRSHRVTEPFPASVLVKETKAQVRRLEQLVLEAEARLATLIANTKGK